MKGSPDRWLRLARRTPLCGALLAAALLVGCRHVGTRVHNLGQLHADDAHHLRSGRLMTDFSYGLYNGFLGVFDGVDEPANKQPKRFDDPVKLCLENLLELGEFDHDDPRVRALQVEWFSRLAVGDPWVLSREFAVRQLGRIGKDLKIVLAERPPEDAPKAGPDQAAEALGSLIQATRPLLARRGVLPAMGFHQTPPEWDEHSEDAPLALRAVCEQIDDLALDLDGALRLLRASALLEVRTAPADKRVTPLRNTIKGLERICLREALLASLLDEDPRPGSGSHPGRNSPKVRAAALVSAVQVFGNDVLAEYLQRLDNQDDAVTLAALSLVQRRGLPRPSGISDEEWPVLRARWIQGILRQGTDHPNGQVRVRALRALATIRGDGSHSLSEDDWYSWWRDEVRPAAFPGAEETTPRPAP